MGGGNASWQPRCAAGRLGKGHKVDDILIFAGQPGSKTTRLMVDNVRLEGSDE
jgi:hypothetical protein